MCFASRMQCGIVVKRLKTPASPSVLAQLDARFKLFDVIAVSIVSLHVSSSGLLLLTLFLSAAAVADRQPLVHMLRTARPFGVLLLMVWAARAFSTPDPVHSPLLELGFARLTPAGIYQGAMTVWRLALVFLMGWMLVTTTAPEKIRAAVQWALHPIPLVPERRTAVMMALMVRFIPVITYQARATQDAQRARCVENRKNPFFRLARLAIPLMRRTFLQADLLASAMTSRCYTETHMGYPYAASRRDWLGSLGIAAVCLAAYWG